MPNIRSLVWLPFLLPSVVLAADLPVLPQATVDTTYSEPTGIDCVAADESEFQSCLANASLNSTITLAAGTTYSGPFTLPNKTSGSGWIHIRSSAQDSLPGPGNRVSPSDSSNMPKIVVSAGGSAVQTANNAHHYRFVGIEFHPVDDEYVDSLITLGTDDTSESTLPEHIIFDRCYIHSDPDVAGVRGVAMDGKSVAVVDSYVSDFKDMNRDSQALWAHNTPGPLLIENNYLEATGECVMTGGSDPEIENLVPADITIRGNHFFKPLSWQGSTWRIKNLLEFKNVERALVEHNTFENNWHAAQTSGPLLISAWTQNNTAPWSRTVDITIRYNRFKNVDQGVAVKGVPNRQDGDHAKELLMTRTNRILIENNVFETNGTTSPDGVIRITTGPKHVTVNHNTMFLFNGITSMYSWDGTMGDNFVFTNNIAQRGARGLTASSCIEGTVCLDMYFPSSYTFTHNAIISASSDNYPSGNFFPVDEDAVIFADYEAGEYRLEATSPYAGAGTDGKDLGADIDAIENGAGADTTPPLVTINHPDESCSPR